MARLERLSYDSYHDVLSFLHPDLYTILPTSVEHRQEYRKYTKRKTSYKQSELLEFVDYLGYYEILPSTNIILHVIKHNCNDSLQWLLKNDYKVNDECFKMAVKNNNMNMVKKLMNVPCPIPKKIMYMTTEMSTLTNQYISDFNKGKECDKEIINGNLESLKKKYSQGFLLSKNACNLAGSCGNLDALIWLKKNIKKTWTSDMYIMATENGHLNIIKWFTKNKSIGWSNDNTTWKRIIYDVAIKKSQWNIVDFCIKQNWIISQNCIHIIVKNRKIFRKLFDNDENQHIIHKAVNYITDEDDCLYILQMLEKTNYFFKNILLNTAIETNNNYIFNHFYRDNDAIDDNSYYYALLHKQYIMFRKLVIFSKKCSNKALKKLFNIKNLKLIKYCINCKVNFDDVILNAIKRNDCLIIKFLVKKNIKLNNNNLNELLKINTQLHSWYMKYNINDINISNENLTNTKEIIIDKCLYNIINSCIIP